MLVMAPTDIAVRPAEVATSERADVALALLLSAWEDSLRSPSTRSAYRHDVGVWVQWLTEHNGPHPLAVGRAHVNAWARDMREQAEPVLAPTTQARRLAAVSSFYRFAEDAGALDRNPAERVTRPRTGPDHVKLTPALTESEAAALVAAGESAQDRALVILLASTGLRVSEALQLALDGITTERGHAVATVHGKGGKVNTVPVVPALAAEVDRIRSERGTTTGPLFVAEHGGPMTRQGAARALTRMAHRAGLGRSVSPHMLRATAITNATLAGIPLERVQRMARHADPRTTMRYNRAAEDLDSHPAYVLASRLADALAHTA